MASTNARGKGGSAKATRSGGGRTATVAEIPSSRSERTSEFTRMLAVGLGGYQYGLVFKAVNDDAQGKVLRAVNQADSGGKARSAVPRILRNAVLKGDVIRSREADTRQLLDTIDAAQR